MKDLSRRDFLKGALAGTASVAAIGILGACSTDTAGTASTADSASETATGEQATTAATYWGMYTPCAYSAQAEGMGLITVTMTFDENSITDVVLDLSSETPDIG